MSANRYTRDQLLIRALNLVDSAAIDQHDRPAGTIAAGAFSVDWLQDALDMFVTAFPISGTLSGEPITLAEGTVTSTLPALTIKDYKDGVMLPDNKGRLARRSLDFLLNVPTGSNSRGKPAVYAIQGNTLHFRPEARETYQATIWVYKMPAVLTGAVVPVFPSDFVLVQYVWLAAQEWHRLIPSGTAYEYARTMIAKLQAEGIGNESEIDQVPFGPEFAGGMSADPTAWMGKVGE